MIIVFGLFRCLFGDRVQTFIFARDFFIALLVFVVGLGASSARATDFVIYDFDDTLMRLPTENYAFLKGEHGRIPEPRKLGLTSSELPLLREDIGRAGTPLERFEIVGDDRDPMRGSFQNARPGRHGDNPFDRDLARALAMSATEREAPLYHEWLQRESSEALRPFTRILTGRGNAAHEMHLAFHRLETLHHGFRAPDAARIIPVGGRGKTADRKAEEMLPLLREAARLGATRIVFADDDVRNLEKSLDVLLIDRATIPNAPLERRLILVREHDTLSFDFRIPETGTAKLTDLREDLLGRIRQAASQPTDLEAQIRKLQLKDAAICRALFF